MKKVQIFEALKTGWTLFMKRPWYLLGLTLATFALFLAASSSGALATALSYIVLGGFYMMLFKHFKGEALVFDDLFTIDTRWVYFAFLSIIKAFGIMLGFICFIIPGFYLIITWMFAEFYVIDKGMRPLEALRASALLTSGHKWKLLLFTFVMGFLTLFGILFFVIGMVIAVIVGTFALMKIYSDLQIQVQEQTETI